MAADPDVLAALQTAHDLESTASEKWHKQEHQWRQGPGRYHGLARWFHRRHREAYCRQHDVRCHMIASGGTVETNLGDTSYTDDPQKAYEDACEILDGLMDAYEAVRAAAKDAGDRATVEKFHGYIHDLKHIYRKGEQRQQEIKDLGLPLFLAQMTRGSKH